MIKYVLVLDHIPNMEHPSIIIYDQILGHILNMDLSIIIYDLVLGHILNMDLSIIIYDQICFSIGSHTKYGSIDNNL